MGQLFKYCQIQKKVVPIDEVLIPVSANIAHGYIGDEMEPTKHPCDKKYYTSKAKFRAVTKAYGKEEVGTAYENGYEPEKEQKREEKKLVKDIMEQIRVRWKG